MKTIKFLFIAIFVLSLSGGVFNSFADNHKKEKAMIEEANVWKGEDGKKRFVCPVMGGEGVVDENTLYTDVDGKRYYHCCAGCPEKFAADPQKYLKDFTVPANVIKVDEDGKHFQCPVSGEMGLVDEKTPYTDHGGKRYYFCCNNCKTKFESDPSKFTTKSESKEVKDDMHHKHDH